ncbi:protein suppressor of white apricot isoform X4 [Drosophila navojoa]|uniref:protein suppressor of white apricot isoform X4 n=1 Tax=Drosophila navojoa TaxID=7232 RepID=UPI000846AC13|nr:protein suppressor of white apricot isoform X4 [Drosophila navojoa]
MMPYNMRACGSNAMVREYAGGSINGILRKTGGVATASATALGMGPNGVAADPRQPPLELLVFGYACKIFRDDEKAREMDHGKQLIPWMGDVNLKIDRYDVRGALCDLSTYEAPPGGYGNRLEYLSADEQRAEQLCEEERYLFLYNNEEELRLQQEEDLKRLQQETSGGNYSQVDFHYDGQSTCSSSGADNATSPTSESSTLTEESELPYTLPPTLLVPPAPGMQLPETMKQHAIIEKTARFIATQGAQMEILIKAKQANNAQFDFLSQGSLLQPYYRHLLAAIKQGKFAASVQTPLDKGNGTSDANAASESPKRSQQVITVPTIKYKPSANCAYTQLISKIKGVPLQTVLDDDAASQHSAGTASPTPSAKSECHSQSSTTATASNGEFTPVLLQYNGSTFAHEAEEDNANDAPPKVELLKNTSALALAQNYSSDSDEEEDENDDTAEQRSQRSTQSDATSSSSSTTTTSTTTTSATTKPAAVLAPPPLLTFPMPEETLRHIIDKTATYVIKNGRQFEETLRTKSVERFSFLLPEHKYYAYYMYKITGDVDAASKEEKTRKAAAVAAALISKKGLGGGTAAAAASTSEKAHVSFAIRARDENTALHPALPQEVSDEDEQKAKSSAEQVRPGMPDSVQRAIKQVETQLLARTGGSKSATAGLAATTPSPLKEQRQAEERVKDKLAQIARDKLNGMVSREKQLQLERKRKAMAFLNQIKSEGSAIGKAIGSDATAASNNESVVTADSVNTDSNDSVRSIPITYFGPDEDDDDDDENDVGAQKSSRMHDDDDDDGDLEKYNLLNDDSTNTFTSKAVPTAAAATASVLLSDDDDVQLVSSSLGVRHRKTGRRIRIRSRSRSRSRRSSSSTSHDASVTSSSSSASRRRSRSRSRSRSSSHSDSRRHRDHHHRDKEESASRRRNHQRHPAKKSHKRHKRRRRSSCGSASP